LGDDEQNQTVYKQTILTNLNFNIHRVYATARNPQLTKIINKKDSMPFEDE
jgi:hypothetical protein